MFLLVSVRHVGAHPDEHQHGVSIQISINLGKTFLRISRIRNIPLIWILARVFCIFTSFHFPDSALNLLNGFDIYFDLFWMAWHWKPAIVLASVPVNLKYYKQYNRNTFFPTGVSFKRGVGVGAGDGPGHRGRSLSFCKECCFMVRVRVRHGFRFRPDAGRNVRLSDISHPK